MQPKVAFVGLYQNHTPVMSMMMMFKATVKRIKLSMGKKIMMN
jgi:hypothetical protein